MKKYPILRDYCSMHNAINMVNIEFDCTELTAIPSPCWQSPEVTSGRLKA